MAFRSGPKIVRPRERIEEGTLIVTGGLFVYIGTQYRRVADLLVYWLIDTTGGETVPGTWTYSGLEYTLVSADPQLGYEDRLGTLTAVYSRKAAWGPTP